MVEQVRRAWSERRVLVVEADEARRTLTAGTLLRAGYCSRGCECAAEALAAFDVFEPHLLLSDVDLGAGPDGVSLATSLARRAPELLRPADERLRAAGGAAGRPAPACPAGLQPGARQRRVAARGRPLAAVRAHRRARHVTRAPRRCCDAGWACRR